MSRKSSKAFIRVLTWNIRGGLHDIHLCRESMNRFNDADILAFTHTGYTNDSYIPFFDGFKLICCSARPLEPISGGVAIYIREHINAQLINDMPEFGMAWIKIHANKKTGKNIFMHACAISLMMHQVISCREMVIFRRRPIGSAYRHT